MPPKDADRIADFIILGPDGMRVQFNGFNEIEELTLTSDSVEISAPFDLPDFQVSFDLERIVSKEIFYIITHGRYPSNNWLKLHGLPLKQKVAKRRRRGITKCGTSRKTRQAVRCR